MLKFLVAAELPNQLKVQQLEAVQLNFAEPLQQRSLPAFGTEVASNSKQAATALLLANNLNPGSVNAAVFLSYLAI